MGFFFLGFFLRSRPPRAAVRGLDGDAEFVH